VTNVIGLQLAIGEVPYLYILVPSSRHYDGVGIVRGETNSGDPISEKGAINNL